MTAEKIEKVLKKKFPNINLTLVLNQRGILVLEGLCSSWKEVVAVGHKAAKQEGVKNVVNHLRVDGLDMQKKDYTSFCAQGKAIGVVEDVDVLIIGAGISGCGIARELAKYKLKILVAEMSDDVATGATKANNGNIHPGHAAKHGTLKAKLNVEGNRMYTQWAQELGFDLQRCGAMGFITNRFLKPALQYSYKKAKKNNVDGVEIINGARARQLEPGLDKSGIGHKVKAALWLPSMGLVEPYKVAVALAENAAENGVQFFFNTTVADILSENNAVIGAITNKGIIKSKFIINCAGVYSDEISTMAGDESYTIHSRKGIIAILDKNRKPEYESLCAHITLDDVKKAFAHTETKGGGVCYTPESNILMGPSASDVPDKDDVSTTRDGLAYAMGRGDKGMAYTDIIRFFSGNRPADYKEDFVIEMSPITWRFINVGAIQSPGLASAPAIAKMVEGILVEAAKNDDFEVVKKSDWQPKRKREVEFRHLSRSEQDMLIKKDFRYGKIICRCESISEGEILDAMRSPLQPTSIDAIKRRTRTGMGRCQGGFCQPRVVELLARELGKDWTDITLKGDGSSVLIKGNRPQRNAEVLA